MFPGGLRKKTRIYTSLLSLEKIPGSTTGYLHLTPLYGAPLHPRPPSVKNDGNREEATQD